MKKLLLVLCAMLGACATPTSGTSSISGGTPSKPSPMPIGHYVEMLDGKPTGYTADVGLNAVWITSAGDGPAYVAPVVMTKDGAEPVSMFFGVRAKACIAKRGVMVVFRDRDLSEIAAVIGFGVGADVPWLTSVVQDICAAGAKLPIPADV